MFFPVVQRGVDATISQRSLGTKFFQEHGAGVRLPRCSVLAFAGHLHHHRVEVDKRDAMLMAVPHGQWRWGYVQRRALALEAAAGAAEGRTTRERAVGVRWPRPADLILMEIQVIVLSQRAARPGVVGVTKIRLETRGVIHRDHHHDSFQVRLLPMTRSCRAPKEQRWRAVH